MSFRPLLPLLFELRVVVLCVLSFLKDLVEHVIYVDCILCQLYLCQHLAGLEVKKLSRLFQNTIVVHQLHLHGFLLELVLLELDVFIEKHKGLAVDLLHLQDPRSIELQHTDHLRSFDGANL